MKRDGFKTSLWQFSSEPFQFASDSLRDTVFDVAIVGGGITGISTAYLLQKAGKNCIVVEANTLCFGTTGGTTAHLNTLLDTPYSTIEKNFSEEVTEQVAKGVDSAIQFIKSNVDELDINCGYEDVDAYIFARDEKQDKELSEILEATKRAGVDAKWTDSIPLPLEFSKAILATRQAKFHPVRYVMALAQEFVQLGGVIVEDCRVEDVSKKEPLQIETSLGSFQAKELVYATHIPPGINLLHLRCAPYRSYAMAVTLSDDQYPEHLTYDMEDPYNYYRTQEIDGEQYLIVGGRDHKTGDGSNASANFLQLEAMIRKQFQVAEIKAQWSSQYFEPTDGLPYIGKLPGSHEHIYVATGFGGNGMVYGSLSAMILKDLIVTGESKYEKIFDPHRIKPVAGFTNFISHNADVVKNFAEKLLSTTALPGLSDLAKGEAKIVKYEHHKVALYKDERGEIHAVSPACTHMKCDVAWNDAEQSWDCPCHGARYSPDGATLTGPASQDLEQVYIEQLEIKS